MEDVFETHPRLKDPRMLPFEPRSGFGNFPGFGNEPRFFSRSPLPEYQTKERDRPQQRFSTLFPPGQVHSNDLPDDHSPVKRRRLSSSTPSVENVLFYQQRQLYELQQQRQYEQHRQHLQQQQQLEQYYRHLQQNRAQQQSAQVSKSFLSLVLANRLLAAKNSSCWQSQGPSQPCVEETSQIEEQDLDQTPAQAFPSRWGDDSNLQNDSGAGSGTVSGFRNRSFFNPNSSHQDRLPESRTKLFPPLEAPATPRTRPGSKSDPPDEATAAYERPQPQPQPQPQPKPNQAILAGMFLLQLN